MRETRIRLIDIAVMLFAFAVMGSTDSKAFPSFGNEVDRYCTQNGRTPSMPFGGDCTLCHNPSDPGLDRTPLFDAYRRGDLDAFCPPSANSPPAFEPIPDQSMSEDGLLSLDVIASDPDGDVLTLEASNLPTGAVFEDFGMGTGRLVWMPTFDQAGSYVVTFRATDDGTPPESVMEEVVISVGDVNRPPTLAPIGAQAVSEGSTLRVALSAEDPDGDVLTFGSGGLPAGATLNDAGNGTAELLWTPTAGEIGSVPITITVTDDGIPMASDAEEFVVTVGGVNQPPVLDPIGDRSIQEGEAVSILLSARDPNGDPLAFECSGAPLGFEVRDAGDGTAVLAGSVAFDQAGNYTVSCIVSDDATPPATDTETFVLTVGDVNRPPKLDPIGMTREGETVVLRLTASDPDGDALSFEVMNLPTGAEFFDYGDGSAELHWTPATGTVGDFTVVFRVFDDGAPIESVEREFTISLQPPMLQVPSIRQARWNPKRGVLRLAGSGAIPREVVAIVDSFTGIVLGETAADDRGRFRAVLMLPASMVPCAISAAGEDGTSGPAAVAKSPGDCPID